MDLLFWAVMVLAPALLFFVRLKHMAHGSGSVSLASGEFEMTISSDHFLSIAFDRAGWSAEKSITLLDAPAKFVEIIVSLVVARTGNWHPASLLTSTWHSLIYPIYALPAWFYVGHGIDALFRRNRVRPSNMMVGLTLALVSGVLCCGFRFGLSAAERQGQDQLNWSIEGLALWALLFAIPFVAWLKQKARGASS